MSKLVLTLFALLITTAAASAQASGSGTVNFDPSAANKVNNQVGFEAITPGIAYFCSYTTDASGKKADFWVSVNNGWALTGSGMLRQQTSASAHLHVRGSALFMGDAGYMLKGSYSMTIYNQILY